MKANEAPEKIFLHPDIGGREFIRPWLKRRASQDSVEYTRTDVSIEKAYEWFKNNWRKYVNTDKDGVVCFGHWEKDFKNYMKGEEV